MEYYLPVIDDLTRLEQWDVASRLLDTVIPHFPKDTRGYDLASALNFKAKRYEIAIKFGELAIASTLDTEAKRAIRFNLGKCYNAANYPLKAKSVLGRNVEMFPQDIDSLLDYCVALYANNEKDEANSRLLALESKLTNDPSRCSDNDAKLRKIVQFNLGTHLIRNGHFKEGMRRLSFGRQLRIWGSYLHNYSIPKWTGNYDAGKRILVVGEGGIGDTIINARFYSHMVKKGLQPSWADNHNLGPMLKRIGYENVFQYENLTKLSEELLSSYDYWVPAMDLPMILDVGEEDLWEGSYITSPKSSYSNSRNKPIRIGLRWSGNPLYEQDLHRSLPLEDMVEALCRWCKQINEKVELVVLQHGKGIEDLDISLQTKLNEASISINPNWADKSRDFDETLCLIGMCDFVISSCTSIAHASAAMGKNTFILTPIMSYYVWANGKNKSPWYGDETIVIHQSVPRSWKEPIAELISYLPTR